MRSVLLIGLFVIGCGSKQAVTPVDAAKDLFSKWQDTTNLLNYLDVTSGKFVALGTFPMLLLVGNSTCSCTTTVTGSQKQGTASLTSCVLDSGVDPGCSSQNNDFTYTKTDTRLTLCSSNGCTVYR